MKIDVGQVLLSLHEDVADLEHEWCDFEQRADGTVFQSFGWLSTWQEYVGRRTGMRPAIVVGRDRQGDMLFLLPLAVHPGRLARRLAWLGSGSSDYNAPLLSPGFTQELDRPAFILLWRRILDLIAASAHLRFDVIQLTRMPPQVGSQPNPFVMLPVTVHPSSAYLAHLAGDWQTFYACSRSAPTRKRDRRKLKHIQQIGQIRYVTPQDADDLARSFEILVAQKSRSFEAMGVRNLFEQPGRLEFYLSLATSPATRSIAHLSRLDVGAQTVAVGLGLVFRDSYYLVLSSYDDGEIARFSPGSAHLHDIMRHAIENGCKVFDFTVGDEPYKRDWSDKEFPLFDYVVAHYWRGALVAGPLNGLARLKRVVKQTPVLWGAYCKARSMLASVWSRPTRYRAGATARPRSNEISDLWMR